MGEADFRLQSVKRDFEVPVFGEEIGSGKEKKKENLKFQSQMQEHGAGARPQSPMAGTGELSTEAGRRSPGTFRIMVGSGDRKSVSKRDMISSLKCLKD